MPNLRPPVTNAALATEYKQRIVNVLHKHKLTEQDFTPLMTLYLTDNTTVQDIIDAKQSGCVYACKLYPAGATTHSAAGVTLQTVVQKLTDVFNAMAEHGLLLLIHGEVTDQTIDIFDREPEFVRTFLPQIVNVAPKLRIVLEHITTADAVEFVESSGDNVAATITCQHILYNRNALFQGGLQPHNYCLPVLKHEQHRTAVLRAATSGSPKFFAGTDSAPHPVSSKHNACCAAGCYTIHAAVELYAQAFDSVGKLDKLNDFVSLYGSKFYGLRRNTKQRRLLKQQWTVPATMPLGSEHVVPLFANQTLEWKLV